MIRDVDPRALPAFLRQITYFSPKGNATAEVISELNKRSRAETRDTSKGKADRVARAKAYFEDELHDRDRWYDRAAYKNAIRYRSIQTLSIICAVTISLIATRYPTFAAGLGAVLAVLLVLSILGNYQVKSLRFRLTAERMQRERRKYVNHTAPYTVGLGENRAYELFGETIEQIIQEDQGS